MSLVCCICGKICKNNCVVCECEKGVMCRSCFVPYSKECAKLNSFSSCVMCGKEFLENNIKGDILMEFYVDLFSSLIKDEDNVSFFISPSHETITSAIENAEDRIKEDPTGKIPKGIKLALKILHPREANKLFKKKEINFQDNIEENIKYVKDRCCAGSFCGGELFSKKKKYHTCGRCNIKYCKKCNYELLPDHVCSDSRQDDFLFGIYSCSECDSYGEYFVGQEKVKCSCGKKYRTIFSADTKYSPLKEYRFDEDDFGEKSNNYLNQFYSNYDNFTSLAETVKNEMRVDIFNKDEILTYFRRLQVDPSVLFAKYCYLKRIYIKRKEYVMKLLSMIEMHKDEELSSKVIKKYI